MEDNQLVIPTPFSLSDSFNHQIKHLPIKRTFDILFSLFALIVGAPLFFFVALAVRLSSKGKIIYFHERIGRGGKPFRCYKFRTMYPNADQRLKEILNQDSDLKKEWELKRKLKNDPRITPIGAFLRKTSLDELPQFWNILVGDLSVVGPRPVVKAEVEKFMGLDAPKILSVRPGLTGIWQVSGRSNTTYKMRIEMDKQYIDSQSFLLDLKLIRDTIPALLSREGAC